MPMLIEHIDAIARKKQRDVLCVTFEPSKVDGRVTSDTEEDETDWFFKMDWENDPMRQQVCQWLTDQHISWSPCGHVASENCMMPYQGQIYIDVPFDETDPTYQRLQAYLEYPDGSLRFPTVKFWYLPLEKAMENAHHDWNDSVDFLSALQQDKSSSTNALIFNAFEHSLAEFDALYRELAR